MKILHVVVTEAFAGTERYVADVATRQASLGHEVSVISGWALRDELPDSVTALPGGSLPRAMSTATRLGKFEVAHAHLTLAELVVTATRGRHKSTCVSTRHIAARRGSTRAGQAARRIIEPGLASEISISRFVANAVDRPTVVLHNGVRARTATSAPEDARVLLIAQRLEPEKNTREALACWFASQLPCTGWSLQIAGAGTELPTLQQIVTASPWPESVSFLGHVRDMERRYLSAGALFASAPREPLGLSVLEAMAYGLPVIAAGGGGHLETVRESMCLYPPGDIEQGAKALNQLLLNGWGSRVGRKLRALQQREFDLDRHVDRLIDHYRSLV